MEKGFNLISKLAVTGTILPLFAPAPALAQPANDMFANRTVITGTNIVVNGSSAGASWEVGEPYHADIIGGASVWWSWKAPAVGTVTISTGGSGFDTVLGVYTGSTLTSLGEAASNDDEDFEGGIYTSKVAFDVTANQTYQIAVDGYDGDSGSLRLSVRLGPLAPPPLAPAWRVSDLDGNTISSSSYAGKVVLLNFWATWCGPCKAEMPDLVSLQTQYGPDGLVIIGADGGWSGDTAQVIKSFLASWTPAVNYEVVMADSRMVAAYGGIPSIPTTFIIDRQNVIRRKFVGAQSRSAFQEQIVPLLYAHTQLGAQFSGGQLALRWPHTAASFTVESTTDPSNPSSWSAWSGTPTILNGTNILQVNATGGGQRYFRLRMP